MDRREWNPGAGRRTFLRTVGAVGGSMIAARFAPLGGTPGLAAASLVPGTAPVAARLGLAVPRSTMYPGLRDQLLAGLKMGFEAFQDQGGDVRIQWSSVEIGVGQSELAAGVKRLIDSEGADLVLAFANPAAVARVVPQVESSRTCLLVLGAGENLVRSGESGPHVFYNTLGYWQGCYALGQRAVRQYGRDVFLLSSPYESGYDAIDAFRLGVSRAGGREAGLAFLDAHSTAMDLLKVQDAITAAQPDVVYLLQSGADARAVLAKGHLFGLTEGRHVVATPFLGESALAGESSLGARGLRSCLSWASGLDSPENRAFVGAFRERTGRDTDAIGLLGYDSASLLVAALGSAGGQREGIRGALETVQWTSPRGSLSMNPATHTPRIPLYLREHRKAGDGVRTVSLEALSAADESSPEVRSLLQRPRQGWTNAYFGA